MRALNFRRVKQGPLRGGIPLPVLQEADQPRLFGRLPARHCGGAAVGAAVGATAVPDSRALRHSRRDVCGYCNRAGSDVLVTLRSGVNGTALHVPESDHGGTTTSSRRMLLEDWRQILGARNGEETPFPLVTGSRSRRGMYYLPRGGSSFPSRLLRPLVDGRNNVEGNSNVCKGRDVCPFWISFERVTF